MADPTPPFSALRALEAAARHRSFTWAARELKITHSAVSQAIRRLEAEFGVRLFERRGSAMEPSEAARRLAESYSAAAQQLTDVIRDVTGEEPTSKLIVNLPAQIADLWLRGRLSRLSESLPDVEVEFSTAGSLPGDADAELVATAKPRAQDQVLAAQVYAPACSSLLAPSLVKPEDLLAARLLGDGSDGWRCWAARYAPGRQLRPTLFESTEDMLKAAAGGAGVALTDVLLVQPHLEAGELVLLPFSSPSSRTLVLRSRGGPAKSEIVERLAMWLKLELARDAAQMRRGPGRLVAAEPTPRARRRGGAAS